MQRTAIDGQWFKTYQHRDFYGRRQKTLPLEDDVEYPKELHENLNKLPFLAERVKIGRKGGISTTSQG